jgi:UTP--glucose-1-phosphate uridylyltransferase
MRKPIRKAIFPVAGLGTRFLPATKAMPKEMLPIVDKPLIEYAVDEARAAGIEEFIFVTSRGKQSIEDHFDLPWELMETLTQRGKTAEQELVERSRMTPGSVAFTRQQEPLGLGHAVWCARSLIGDEPFAVLLADDLVKSDEPCLAQMIETYNEVGGNVVAVMDVPRDQTNKYGVLDVVEDDGRIARAQGLVEKPAPEDAPSTLSVIGRYVLQPEVFQELDKQTTGAGGEIQLTDAIAATIPAVDFHGLRFEGHRFDCGSKEGFLEATVAYALARPDLGDAMRDVIRRYG